MRVASTCICLFLILLAVSQISNNCTVKPKANTECGNFLNSSHKFNNVMEHNYRILIYSHHFEQLNKKQKICVLKKIIGFYTEINAKVWTTKIPEKNISSLHQDLVYFEASCIKCKNCIDIFENMKQLKGCSRYNKRMVLNGTEIVNCQLRLLKTAKRKKKTQAAEIQEKSIYELDTLLKFLRKTIKLPTQKASSS